MSHVELVPLCTRSCSMRALQRIKHNVVIDILQSPGRYLGYGYHWQLSYKVGLLELDCYKVWKYTAYWTIHSTSHTPASTRQTLGTPFTILL